MKNRLSLLVLMLTFICLAASGQKNNNTPQSITPTEISLQDSIQSLRADNADLRKQLDRMEKNMEEYKWYFGQTVDDHNDKIAIGIAIITLILAVFGIAIPYSMNSRNEKYISKLIEDTKKQAQDAESELKNIQPKVEEAKKQVGEIQTAHNSLLQKVQESTAQAENARTALVNSLKKVQEATTQANAASAQAKKAEDALKIIQPTVEETAKKAKAIQYFIQALQESDPDRAIDYYDNCIDLDPDFAEAYNKRGYLRYKNNDIDGAKEDFEKAIAKKKNYSEAYNNLGVLLLSQKNFDDDDENYDDAEDNFNLAGEYAEAILNLGLLKYAKGERDADDYFYKAIELKPNFAEAYYIRGLYKVDFWYPVRGVENIIKAKYYKPNVIEAYPNRNLLTREIKEWDNSFNRVEYSRDLKTLIRIPMDKKGNFKIPNSVTVIVDGAFVGCTSLTSIEIPNSVTEIGNSAFMGCTSLSSIVIPNNVTEIGEGAFVGCTSLSSIVIPNSVTKIGLYAFEVCTSLTEFHLKHTSPIDFSEAFETNLSIKIHVDPSKITLYVPKGSGEAYKKHKLYSHFKEIIEE